MTEEQVRAAGIPYVVGRCDLATTPRGAIAGHGGLLKADLPRRTTASCSACTAFGDRSPPKWWASATSSCTSAPAWELFLTLPRSTHPPTATPTTNAPADGLTRLAEEMGLANPAATAVEDSTV